MSRIQHNLPRVSLAAFALIAISVIASVAAHAVGPGGFNLPWSTIEGGGGTSGGGAYVLNGSIGQFDAGSIMSGGQFALSGGFWSGTGTTPVCLADIFPPGGSGIVDIDDLLTVINNWGAGSGNVADITGNGIVDIDDLLAVVNAWGSCS
jgi:hypothetical protein